MFTKSDLKLWSIFSVIFLLVSIQTNLKAQDAVSFNKLGKKYLIEGDYSNAESMLFSAYKLDTSNLTYINDLALCLYLEKEFEKALQIIQPITDSSGSGNDQSFQIAGSIYLGLRRYAACEELYKRGLSFFPDNGALNNEMGELLFMQNRSDCIQYWEKGIEKDPSYAKNYYNATKFYSNHNEYLWSLIYGEIYVNIDPYGSKTAEIKDIILKSYQNLFNDLLANGFKKDKNNFSEKVISIFFKQKTNAVNGLSVNSLTMIRTGFILDWYDVKPEKYPFHLFEFQRQLLRDGLFEAYNQWLFGTTDNLSAFQSWTQLHNQEYTELTKFLKSNLFKVPIGQYYR